MHSAQKEKEEMGQHSAEHTKVGLDSCWCVHFQFFWWGAEERKRMKGTNMPCIEEPGNVGWKNKVLKEEIP